MGAWFGVASGGSGTGLTPQSATAFAETLNFDGNYYAVYSGSATADPVLSLGAGPHADWMTWVVQFPAGSLESPHEPVVSDELRIDEENSAPFDASRDVEFIFTFLTSGVVGVRRWTPTPDYPTVVSVTGSATVVVTFSRAMTGDLTDVSLTGTASSVTGVTGVGTATWTLTLDTPIVETSGVSLVIGDGHTMVAVDDGLALIAGTFPVTILVEFTWLQTAGADEDPLAGWTADTMSIRAIGGLLETYGTTAGYCRVRADVEVPAITATAAGVLITLTIPNTRLADDYWGFALYNPSTGHGPRVIFYTGELHAGDASAHNVEDVSSGAPTWVGTGDHTIELLLSPDGSYSVTADGTVATSGTWGTLAAAAIDGVTHPAIVGEAAVGAPRRYVSLAAETV